MAKVGDAYPSKYLKADDFKGSQNVTLTVKAAPLEDSFGEKKIVLYFYETDKAFTLNPTNARIMVQLLEDDESDNWTGAKVTLAPAMRQIAGTLKKVIDVTAAYHPHGQTHAAKAGPQPDAFGGGFGARDTTRENQDNEIPF